MLKALTFFVCAWSFVALVAWLSLGGYLDPLREFVADEWTNTTMRP